MKKIVLFFSVAFLLIIPTGAVFAQESTNQPETIDLAKIDYRYNALLEFFLQLAQEKKYEQAYGYTAGNFPKLYNLDDFTQIINESGLTTFTEKKWTSFKDEMQSIGVTTVKGDFTTPDGVIHHVTFFVIIGGETEIKVGHISEEVATADLAKRFPPQEELNKTIKEDLLTVTRMIRKNQSAKLYKSLSQAAKNRIKLRDVRKALLVFRKNKTNIRLPKKVQFTVRENSPTLSADGLMLVQGAYRNKTSDVEFLLGYDYEDWQWKPGVFSFSTKSIAAAATPVPQGAATLSK